LVQQIISSPGNVLPPSFVQYMCRR